MMAALTRFWAWLIGYYWDRCPVCGHGIAILNDGRIIGFCSQRKHRAASAPEGATTETTQG